MDTAQMQRLAFCMAVIEADDHTRALCSDYVNSPDFAALRAVANRARQIVREITNKGEPAAR